MPHENEHRLVPGSEWACKVPNLLGRVRHAGEIEVAIEVLGMLNATLTQPKDVFLTFWEPTVITAASLCVK